MSDLSAAADASNAPVLLHPGQFVRIRSTGARVMIIGHEIDIGTVVYRVASPNGVGETGFLVKELERCE
ncbi:MAG: hypothetical protein ACR2M1_15795 [Gemmatimonadaceae bacterium]